jgi:ornithine carbamoyltransferase
MFCQSTNGCPVVQAQTQLRGAPTHMLADTEFEEEHSFKVINLSNLKLVFLPANTTSVCSL